MSSKIIQISLLLIGLLSVLAGASTACSPVLNSAPTPPTALTELTTALPQKSTSQVTESVSPSPDSQLLNLIQQAKADLAQRLSIKSTEIKLLEITSEEWPDAGLGCPKPGMDYIQVLTPGYRILLELTGTVYEYHSKGSMYVVYCENLNPPGVPKP